MHKNSLLTHNVCPPNKKRESHIEARKDPTIAHYSSHRYRRPFGSSTLVFARFPWTTHFIPFVDRVICGPRQSPQLLCAARGDMGSCMLDCTSTSPCFSDRRRPKGLCSAPFGLTLDPVGLPEEGSHIGLYFSSCRLCSRPTGGMESLACGGVIYVDKTLMGIYISSRIRFATKKVHSTPWLPSLVDAPPYPTHTTSTYRCRAGAL